MKLFLTHSPDSYRDCKLIKGVSLTLTNIAMCEETSFFFSDSFAPLKPMFLCVKLLFF